MNQLNLLTLFTPPTQSQSQASSFGVSSGVSSANSTMTASAGIGVNIGDVAFGQLLQAQLQNAKVAAPLANVTANMAQVRQLGGQLKAAIAQLLQNGATLEQVVTELAKTLGDNVVSQLQTQLGTSVAPDVQSAITQMLAQALGPPANGPPAPPAQAAAALVDRLIQVADTLAGVSGTVNAAGQQLESLGNTISDANAGDNPAPPTTKAILRDVLAALQPFVAAAAQSNPAANANATSNSTLAQTSNPNSNGPAFANAPIQPPAPWVPTTVSLVANAMHNGAVNGPPAPPASNATALAQSIAQTTTDGPAVANNPVLTLVGTGGDTVIGRILARAANVAATQTQNQPQPAASTSPSSSSGQTSTATLQPQIAVASAGNSSSNGSSTDVLLASALRSLQAALASLPPPKSNAAGAGFASAQNALAGVTQSASSVFGALGVSPVVNTVTGSSSGSALPQTAQAQLPANFTDPNTIVDQVLKGIAMQSLPDGTQTVRMRLVPESLGDVTVNLQVQNGSINATLVAQNADVRDALLAGQQSLVQSLNDAGLKLSSFTVNLSNGGLPYQQPQNQSQPQFGTTRRSMGLSPSGVDDAVAAVPTYGLPQTQLAALQWLNALA